MSASITCRWSLWKKTSALKFATPQQIKVEEMNDFATKCNLRIVLDTCPVQKDPKIILTCLKSKVSLHIPDAHKSPNLPSILLHIFKIFELWPNFEKGAPTDLKWHCLVLDQNTYVYTSHAYAPRVSNFWQKWYAIYELCPNTDKIAVIDPNMTLTCQSDSTICIILDPETQIVVPLALDWSSFKLWPKFEKGACIDSKLTFKSKVFIYILHAFRRPKSLSDRCSWSLRWSYIQVLLYGGTPELEEPTA